MSVPLQSEGDGGEQLPPSGSTPTLVAAPEATPAVRGPAIISLAATQPVVQKPNIQDPASQAPYVPQFSSATQMILSRMKGSTQSPSLSSVLSTSRGLSTISSTAYQDAKRRLVAGMNTSTGMTMAMPTPPASMTMKMPVPPPRTALPREEARTPSRSLPGAPGTQKKVNSPLSARGKSNKASSGNTILASSSSGGKKAAKTMTGTPRSGTKRKRGRAQDDDRNASDLSDSEAKLAPTTTKSGRQVQKPTTYNPAAMDSSTKKRAHYGKRTVEQALCRRCTRMAFTDENQIVFCDGCDGAWHQMCHDPEIEEHIVNSDAKWFCASCSAKKERHATHKKTKVESHVRNSWARRTAGQKRAYFLSLSQTELVNLLMYSIELHPDLPVFPSDDSTTPQAAANGNTPRSLFAGSSTEGLFMRADEARKISGGSNNPTSSITAATTAPTSATAAATAAPAPTFYTPQARPGPRDDGPVRPVYDPEEEDPTGLMEAWPKPGRGMFSKLPPESLDDFMVDNDDYEAFSHIVYDGKGRKIWENGVDLTKN